jgi:glycerophosphoryl diester phosphodiesterase
VVAHRGASAREPENTLAAFEAAAREGADVIELDVRLTADGVPVILHDPDVSATTDGKGYVHEMTLGQVKGLNASGRGATRHEIPTLAEALDSMRGRGLAIDLEIKNLPGEPAFDSPREAVLEASLAVLAASGFEGPALVSSFNWLSIERSRELAPEVPTGFLSIGAVDAWAALVYARQAGHDFVLPQTNAVTAAGEGFVQEAHQAQVRVGTWVADDEELLTTLFRWGVDAVASNDPALAVAVRDRVAPTAQ